VRVQYDGAGSLGLWRSWWRPLSDAGGEVVEYEPLAPWRRRFRIMHVFFRDHRKVLVVDRVVGFTGGINRARQWLPESEGGLGWRDDVVEIRAPSALALREVVERRWGQTDRSSPPGAGEDAVATSRVRVLANRVGTKPDRRIRRDYLRAIRAAQTTIDIANAYFLPGPLFLVELRQACRRGVRVRLVFPLSGDIWLASVATRHLAGRLAGSGVEVYAYGPRMMHSKVAILDARLVTIGSHNLDTVSWRYNLECNVVVDDAAFAAVVGASFERDVAESVRIDGAAWRARPRSERALGWIAARFRMLL
jgi:cardiolipin synthase